MSGLYIALDGIEGCGKSTLISMLECDYDFIRVREPGGTKYGEMIRELLLFKNDGNMDPTTEALLFMADRRETWVNIIEPALMNNRMVISDRCLVSTYAHQVCAQGMSKKAYNSMWEAIGSARPAVIIIDISVDVAKERIKDKKSDRYEKMGSEYHNLVRRGYLQCADKVVRGNKHIDTVIEELKKVIDELGGHAYRKDGPTAILGE